MSKGDTKSFTNFKEAIHLSTESPPFVLREIKFLNKRFMASKAFIKPACVNFELTWIEISVDY